MNTNIASMVQSHPERGHHSHSLEGGYLSDLSLSHSKGVQEPQ